MLSGTAMVGSLGLKSSVYTIRLPAILGGGASSMYAAVPALLLNLVVAVILTLVLPAKQRRPDGTPQDAQLVLD